jgi:hypothetical protein
MSLEFAYPGKIGRDNLTIFAHHANNDERFVFACNRAGVGHGSAKAKRAWKVGSAATTANL